MGETPGRHWRATRWTASTVVGVGSLLGLWWLVEWTFSSDRGVGFRDEGLYLLAADPPSPTARWVTPFGWHTAPFFQAFGYDIADLRTFAVWLLVVTGALFGWALGRRVTGAEQGREAQLTRGGLAAVGALGAPLLTSGLLRTPGYNWVNLVGLLVAATGALLAPTLPTDGPGWWRSWRAHAVAAAIALGAWFTVPGKPSSAPLFLAAAAVYIGVQLRRRTATLALMTAAWGLVWTALGLIAGWWPTEFLTVLRRSAQFPPLDRNQTIPGAFRDVLRTPKVALQDLADLRPAALVLVACAAVVAALAFRRTAAPLALRIAPLTLCAIAAVGTAVPWPVLGEPDPFVRFAWYGTTNAGVLLFVGGALHVLANWPYADQASWRRGRAAAGLCIVTVFIFGFGSAMSIYHQAALAATLMWCAAGALVASVGGRLRVPSVALMVAASAALLVSNVVDSRHHPFDTVDVATQTTPTGIGAHGDELLLDEPTADFLGRLQAAADEAGFCLGDRVIGMVWDWTSTTAFALGATVPEHLILTIFGYPEAASVLDVTIRDLEGPEWADAWLMTSDLTMLPTDDATELRVALDRLPAAVGRSFPRDYTQEADVDGTQLWRPTDVAPAACE